MLHLITGTPGSGKTLYAVYLIDKQEINNKNALKYNAKTYIDNKKIIQDNQLSDYFLSHTYFSKVEKQEITVYFDENHFDYFEQQERREDIFLDVKFYNEICKKIKEELDITLKPLRFVRHQYANIDGLKVDNVREIHVDWRECPDGSIIFYDEIQLIDEYSNDNKRDEKGIVKYLTVHRHRAFDIYGITQFPRLVHAGFRDVVGLHYHLHRGWGAKAATVYVWANCREKPNSLGNKFTAERDFRFNYPKRLYEVYESATADTVRFRIPIKFILLLLIPIFGALVVIYALSSNEKTFFDTIFGSDQDKPTQTTNKTQNQVETVLSETETEQQIKALCSNEQNKALQVCKDYQASTLAQSPQNAPQTQNISNQTIYYDISKPYDVDTSQIGYEVTEKPILTGCIEYQKQCKCYTQQATIINMSYKDCKRYISGDRPFNYFKQNTYQYDYRDTVQYSNDSASSSLPAQQTQAESQSKIINQGSNNSSYFQTEKTELLGLTSYDR